MYFHLIYSLTGSWVGGDFRLTVSWMGPINLWPSVPLSLLRNQRAFGRKLWNLSNDVSLCASMVLINDYQGDVGCSLLMCAIYKLASAVYVLTKVQKFIKSCTICDYYES